MLYTIKEKFCKVSILTHPKHNAFKHISNLHTFLCVHILPGPEKKYPNYMIFNDIQFKIQVSHSPPGKNDNSKSNLVLVW